MNLFKKIIAALAAAALAAVLAGCGGGEAENQVLRTLYSSELTTLNYLTAANQADQAVGANCIDTLVEYDSHGNIQPSLAMSWKTSADGLTWTFELRKGVGWYNSKGVFIDDVTANDFVAAAKYALTPKYASQSNNPLYVIKNAEKYYKGETSDFSEVGVKAINKYTLEYTLSAPVPYFLSSLTYVCYMPAYGPLLDELGERFGTSNDTLYYCGAYILSEYLPQQKQVYVKNTQNWDSASIFIERVEKTYNSEAASIAPEMVLRGELDYADISADILPDWQQNHADYLSPGREKCDYSYFFCFNFDPQFEDEYEPENWSLAVNNLNFRLSIASALDREYISAAYGSGLVRLQTTVTPAGFAVNDGEDYTNQTAFRALADGFGDTVTLRDAARAELTAAGATFPIKMMVVYRPDDTSWVGECTLLEQQLENALGKDFIDVCLVSGPTENFLSKVRRSGNYAFMRCNWGADYADPETYTDPFTEGNTYNFSYKQLGKNNATDQLVSSYLAAVEAAKSVTSDTARRYELFAKAECMLIENAVVIPYMVTPVEYRATRINVFDTAFAPCGISILRYKDLRMQESFIDAAAFERNRASWEAGA